MNTEYEALFSGINTNEIRDKIVSLGGTLIHQKTLQKRTNLHLPEGKRGADRWLRVRTKDNKTTLAFKMVVSNEIEGQKELEFTVGSHYDCVALLEQIGCEVKANQESYREAWKLNGVEITIDEWPFLEPYIEIEGKSENEVRDVSNKLNLNWSDAKFCTVSKLYAEKYNITDEYLENEIKDLSFDGKNPFHK